MKILVTAFDPFGGETVNPAQEAVRLLRPEIFSAEIIKLEVPTVFGKSIRETVAAMTQHQPNAVLSIGQAGGRCAITPERVAINLDDVSSGDNEGNQPKDQPIYPDGDAAYFSSLPIKAIVKNICAAGLPASISNSAGTFVCNHLMYGVLYHAQRYFPGVRAGFIHVPFIPQQVITKRNVPSMALADIVRGLEIAVQTIIETETDIPSASEGTDS